MKLKSIMSIFTCPLQTTLKSTSYYENIFSEISEIKLSYNQKESWEGLLSVTGCLESLKTIESDKSSWTNGIPAEFYNVFGDDLSPFLFAALNTSFTQGHLSISQQRELITLIPN